MNKTIIYSPFVDWKLYALFEQKAKEILAEEGRSIDFSKFSLEAKTPLQEFIKALNFSELPEKFDNFYHAAGAFISKEQMELKEFLQKHDFSLEPPMPTDSNGPGYEKKGITVAAVMELIQEWPEGYNARKDEYDIEPELLVSKEEIRVKGYRLRNMKFFHKSGIEVIHSRQYSFPDCQSALINLNDEDADDFSIVLTDISFYAQSIEEFEKQVTSPLELCKVVEQKPVLHNIRPGGAIDTYALLPSLEEQSKLSGNLVGMSYQDARTLDGAEITGSEMLSKLRLNEKGVYARSEGWATGHVLITACAHDIPDSWTFSLTVKMGLVVDIRFKGKSIFLAYIPQSRFHRS